MQESQANTSADRKKMLQIQHDVCNMEKQREETRLWDECSALCEPPECSQENNGNSKMIVNLADRPRAIEVMLRRLHRKVLVLQSSLVCKW